MKMDFHTDLISDKGLSSYKVLKEAVHFYVNPAVLINEKLEILCANESFYSFLNPEKSSFTDFIKEKSDFKHLDRFLSNALSSDRTVQRNISFNIRENKSINYIIKAKKISVHKDPSPDYILISFEESKKSVRQRAEHCRQSDEVLESLFSIPDILIALMDKNFNFIRVNEAYAEYGGHDPDYFIGKNHFDLYPHQENEQIFKKVVETGERYKAYAKPFEYPDRPELGTTYWDWSLSPLINQSGEVEGVALILNDVTERVKSRDALIKAQKELNDSKRLSELGTLAASVAHDLRNPLATIKTAVFNIKRKCKTGDISGHINNINKKVTESNQIINNLLFYSRLKPPDLKKTNVISIVDDCIRTIKEKYIKRKIKFIKNYFLDDKRNIHADPVQLKEVFTNILDNAAEAVPEDNGRIEINAEFFRTDKQWDKGCIKVSIKDNGEGIEKKDIERVLEPFFSRKTQGTGLGLSVTKRIIDMHVGEMEIFSEKNKGTEIVVMLPYRKDQSEQKNSNCR